MRLSRLLAALGVALSIALPVHAQDAERVKAELKKKLPDMPVESVRRAPLGGLYEVLVGGEIMYTDEKASFMVVGSLIDLKTRENVTEARLRQLTALKSFDELPLDRAIKIVRGNGSRKVAVFEDPNCGYCKRFERDLLGVNDITVYVFLYPILSPDSMEKSKAVWCAADRGKAWIDMMVRDTAPGSATGCSTPLDQLLAFGREKRIQGTPTIFFENGERIPGAMPIAEFEKKLAAAKAPATASR